MNDTVRAYLERIESQAFFSDEEQVGSLKWNVAWYRKKASHAHLYFRVVGFATVLLSVSLPFMLALWQTLATATEGANSETFLGMTATGMTAVISWLIAIAGGACGFFQWGRSWQSRTEAYLRLERLFLEWQVSVRSPTATIETIVAATQKMVIEARETIKSETSAFFDEVQFPEVDAPKKQEVTS